MNRNAKVYMASRNRERAEEAIADLKKQTGKEAVFLDLDLANLKSIKKAAETFLRSVIIVFWHWSCVLILDTKP